MVNYIAEINQCDEDEMILVVANYDMCVSLLNIILCNLNKL